MKITNDAAKKLLNSFRETCGHNCNHAFTEASEDKQKITDEILAHGIYLGYKLKEFELSRKRRTRSTEEKVSQLTEWDFDMPRDNRFHDPLLPAAAPAGPAGSRAVRSTPQFL